MSTLQHKQVKSQKEHLKILGAGGPRGQGQRADIWGRGPRKTNTRKIQRKMHTNQNKCQVDNCPALPRRSLISTCNRRMKSVTAGRVEISSRQTEIM